MSLKLDSHKLLLSRNFRSPALAVLEWLKSDMWEVTVLVIDNIFLYFWGKTLHKGGERGQEKEVQLVSKCIIYPPGNIKTIWLVLVFTIISKSTSFLLKFDLHCNLPNFRHVSNTSVQWSNNTNALWFKLWNYFIGAINLNRISQELL